MSSFIDESSKNFEGASDRILAASPIVQKKRSFIETNDQFFESTNSKFMI